MAIGTRFTEAITRQPGNGFCHQLRIIEPTSRHQMLLFVNYADFDALAWPNFTSANRIATALRISSRSSRLTSSLMAVRACAGLLL
jgi:hypothetical protein